MPKRPEKPVRLWGVTQAEVDERNKQIREYNLRIDALYKRVDIARLKGFGVTIKHSDLELIRVRAKEPEVYTFQDNDSPKGEFAIGVRYELAA